MLCHGWGLELLSEICDKRNASAAEVDNIAAAKTSEAMYQGTLMPGQLRILVIEGSEDIYRLVCQTLRRKDLNVLTRRIDTRDALQMRWNRVSGISFFPILTTPALIH